MSSSSRSSQISAGTDASMSELAISDACFSQSTDGSDVAMTDTLSWSRMTGSVSSELSLAHVSSLGSTMKGPACSFPPSSDATVCASLVRAASAKSSPLMHARVTDNHPRSATLAAATPMGSAATPPTQQHVSSEGEFRPAPRLSKPISVPGLRSSLRHVLERGSFGSSYLGTSPRVSGQPLCMKTKDGLLSAAEADT